MPVKTSKDSGESSDRYRALFENSADAILIMEKDKFVDCNQAAVDMLRYEDKQALLQCHPSELSPEYQPDGQRSYDKANRILAGISQRRSQRFEWVHVRSDGESFPVEVLMTAIPADEGLTLHIVWRDITERKRLETELRHSQKMETLGSLAGGIAHDFNNTLVPIVTYSELLARSLRDDPKRCEWAREISRAGALAASLVKKLLTVSRKDERIPVVLDLGQTISDTLAMLKKLIGEDIRVHFQPFGQELWVETDPGDIEQILLNLASNARDALPKGGEIGLALSQTTHQNRDYARLEFSDNGAGMDEETLGKIFAPFFTTKELGSGTGLGMSSVHELVTKADGTISVRSKPREGTTIEILLPICPQPSEASAGSDKKSDIFAGESEVASNAKVLVVEDDPQISRLICSLLDEEGFRVQSANNGLNAFERLETQTPDLVLADVVMPDMSGPQMIKKMHTMGLTVPVIFLSGYTDDRLAAHGFDPQKISLIRKPFTASVLMARVDEALSGKRALTGKRTLTGKSAEMDRRRIKG